jgi:hypothetical protein
VHIGLPYRAVATTLDLLNPQGDDTGITKGIPKWMVRLNQSAGVKIGRTEETAEELPPLDGEDGPTLRSGVFPLNAWEDWATDQPCAIVQDAPLPMTVLGMTTELEYGGTE